MELYEHGQNLKHLYVDSVHLYYLAALLALVFVCFKFAKLMISRAQQIKVLEAFPGPPTHWLFGHVHEVRGICEKHKYRVSKFKRDILTCIVYDPSEEHPLQPSCFPGNGLLVSQGQKWFRHRRLLTPGFHYDVLKPYVKLIADSTKTMLDKWETHAKTEKSFDVFGSVSLMTLDSIMKCAFSCNSNCQTESGTNAYIKAVYDLCTLVNTRFRIFPYHSEILFHLSPHGYQFRKACQLAHRHTEEVIKKRKEALKNQKEDLIPKKRYLDFLDILLCASDENQQGLSDEDLRAEVDTFMFEGHDTTASGISWIFYTLACHSEHQQKCREEILQVLGDKDTMDWEDLAKIPYTSMCIKESLRLYPPVPGISRKLTKPMMFSDGRSVPAGFLVSVSIFGLHRNATVWENPNMFDPLRYLPENTAKRSPHAFVPFSAGPRNCIGQTFAMNEMKVAVALTLRRYELIKDPYHTPKMLPRLVLRSLNGIYLKIRPKVRQK
uniref:aromatase n=1 Tax=Denticeps clupeoides TaxID=299321 RepID=A0AAY4CVD4_9TELE